MYKFDPSKIPIDSPPISAQAFIYQQSLDVKFSLDIKKYSKTVTQAQYRSIAVSKKGEKLWNMSLLEFRRN